MKVFLAGTWSRKWIHDEYDSTEHKPYILESFYYLDEDVSRLLPRFGDFLLDSGAFTFMQGNGKDTNWEKYIDDYAQLVKQNKIKKYFELDIDSVVGYEKVKEYRKILERKVGWECIPVWHKNRGGEEYKRHCEEYGYVAIGGYVVRELTPRDYKAFPSMIRYAHQHNAKVHCLGFTRLSDLSKYHFDSVDSTAWTNGNKFGHLCYFDGKTIRKKEPPEGYKLGDTKAVAMNNFTEWVKFQRWAKTHL